MTPNHNLTKWLLGITICILLLLLCIISDLSMRDHHDHWNLRYVIWKAGLRDYNATEVLSGTTHDHTFHERLRGISVKEFEVKFPPPSLRSVLHRPAFEATRNSIPPPHPIPEPPKNRYPKAGSPTLKTGDLSLSAIKKTSLSKLFH
jgi:hypothetical protein